MSARIVRIAGTLAEAAPFRDAALYDLVRVGRRGLLAEVIRFDGDRATLQVFEDTTGLAVGEGLETTGTSLAVELGPGLLGGIFDGVGRPLERLADATGDFIAPGATAPTLDRRRKWRFIARMRANDTIAVGDLLGTVDENGVEHRVLADRAGTIDQIGDADVTVDEPFGTLADGTPLTLARRWSVRRPRPVADRLPANQQLVTGQRVFDLLFPIAEGGTVAVPGGFGTGKTIVEHSLAKYADADVVVFIGCGERGNEIAEVISDFRALVDPRTGRPMMERTVLVVNTSNMPVVAREASVALGITIAEYFRDMGYRVAVMIDSLSRWAEALRDIGARLQEMPGEEGYPTYMASRLGVVFERAGRARVLGSPARTGAVTIVSAVSPPGGDFSEPVTQAALRVTGALWALDAQLARARQFPAVDWSTSYSLYPVGDMGALRTRIISVLQRDSELREVASLLGVEEMEDRDRLVLAIAAVVRDHVLGQNAFDPNDAMSTLAKTSDLATFSMAALDVATEQLERGRALDELPLDAVRKAIASLRRASPTEYATRRAEVLAGIASIGGST